MREQLRNLAAPEPSADLLGRILRSRAAGVRTALPVGNPSVRAGAIIGTLVVVVLTGFFWIWRTPIRSAPASVSYGDPLDLVLGGTMLWPSAGAAQETRTERPQPRYPVILSDSLDISRLTPGAWMYRSETTTDGVFTDSSGGDRIRLMRSTLDAQPAWMVNTARRHRSLDWRYDDTTYLDAATLRPLRTVYSGYNGRTRFEQTFSADSGKEAIDRTGPTAKSWRGSIALPFGRTALFLNDWTMHRLAVLSPAFHMSREWRGSLYQVALISWGGARSVTTVDLRVLGSERITVPAGTFDCWRVEVFIHLWEPERLLIWVSRDKGWVIKQQTRWSDFVVNRVLESYEGFPGN